ncbi:prolipoprotein diacylglyceryl transferase [Chitinophaga sancti]|uniref:prolipoprotein diacylglyceryl transferase n=1 Tax=Chitinophaga sancti TaxID=1004 RepID=UPI002A7475EF|nr:prolipoprotein diacylglyceryl transferase [Chitinophaga sancti]WPQ62676.1 prolipoprotein diacylglyceryl transferase [Chitinophaga sancti]
MTYIKWNIDPVFFEIGGHSLRYYSLFFALGFILSFQTLRQIFISQGIPEKLLEQLSIYIIAGTLIGARLGHCLFYEAQYYLVHPLEIVLPFRWTSGRFTITGFQGLASHGGAIGIFTGLLLYARKYKLPFLWLLDKLCIVIPLCGACIRIGNFFNSEIIGKTSSVQWAIIFERVDQMPRHPAQLYEAICYLGLFLIFRFLLLNFHTQRRPGRLSGYFIISLFTIRFLMEFLKANQETFEDHLPLNMGQLLSIPFIMWGVYLVIRTGRLKNSSSSFIS